MKICVVYSLLGLDNVPMNMYASFDHTLVIIYWRVVNYGYGFEKKNIRIISKEHILLREPNWK